MKTGELKIKVYSLLSHNEVEIEAIDMDPETGTIEILIQ